MTIFSRMVFAPTPPLDGTHLLPFCLVCDHASNQWLDHAARMSCDLSELLEQTRPPDSELVDLIEKAYLEGQIDGKKADLGYLWFRGHKHHFCTNCYSSRMKRLNR